MQTTPDTASPPAGPPARPPRRGWRGLAAVLCLLCALAGATAWLTGSERGFATLWRGLSALSGGALSVGRTQGTLWQGFTLEALHVKTADMDTRIDRLSLDWTPSALWQRSLHVRRIEVGNVQLQPDPSAPPSPPPQLPSSLSLPFDVRIDAFTVQALSFSGGAFALYDLSLSYRYERAQHQLRLSRLRLAQGALSGHLSIGGQAPFAVRGALGAQAEAGGGELTLGGSLQRLTLQGRVRAAPVEVDLAGRFAPFAAQPFDRIEQLDLRTRDVDPHSLLDRLPRAAFDLDVHVEPAGAGGARGTLQLQNRMPGPLSSGRVPVSGARAAFTFDDSRLNLSSLLLQLPAGTARLNGHLDKSGSSLTLRLDQVGLRALDAAAPDDIVQGDAHLDGRLDAPRLRLALQGRRLSVAAQVDARRQTSGAWSVDVPQARLSAGGGRLDLSGRLDAQRVFQLRGQLVHLNPGAIMPGWPKGDINAAVQAGGSLAEPLKAALGLTFAPSRLSGAPLGGGLQARLTGKRLQHLSADLDLAGNHVKAQGAWGAPGDRLQLALDAPALARLGFGFSGSARGRLELSGQPSAPRVLVDLKGQQLGLPGRIAIQALNLSGDVREGGAGKVQAQLAVQGASGDGWRADVLQARLGGTQARHVLELGARLQAAGQPWPLALQLSGGWDAPRASWHGSLQRLELAGSPGLKLLAPVTLAAGREGFRLGAARLNVAGGTLALEGFERRADGRLSSRGRLDGLALAALRPWIDLPPTRSLTLEASWTLRPDGRGSLTLERQQGDLHLDQVPGAKPLGLEHARVQLDWGGSQTRFALNADARGASLQANGTLSALPWQIGSNTPMSARVQAGLPDLGALAAVSGMQGEAGGTLTADLRVSGPLSRPGARGAITGHRLLWRDRKTGVRLSGGELAARIDGRTLFLDTLRFASGEGFAMASGRVDMQGAAPTAAIRVQIQHFSVFDRPDRRLVVSGTAAFSLSDRLIALSGQILADEGRLTLPKAGTPSLSDDVVVVGRPVEQSSLASLPVQVDLLLDLGRRFSFEAPGLKVELAGKVLVKAHQGVPPTARGVVKVVRGNYKAYGQELEIEAGTITFVGPLDNPNLNIRAKRRLSPVGAGVEVTGSVSAPKLQLIADEALSERDKLAWLVLGHAADDNAQDSNFLALAASQMAAGSINDKMGLFDDVGLSRKQSKTALNGTVSPAEQVLTVGKQLSQTFYLGYEYGLTSSQQALKVIYQLSRGWSLLLRVGANASAESRYTLRFD